MKISKNVDVDVYISMDDIINGLNEFNSKDLRRLSNELNILGYFEHGITIINPKTLYDEMRLEVLIDLYNTMSLEELTSFKK